MTTVGYERSIEVGDPVSQARIYQSQAADELIILDLDAWKEGRLADLSILQKIATEVFMPLTVGGGARTLEHFRELLLNGADKVSINSEALARPELIREASQTFGSQCVVVSIDYRLVDGVPYIYSASSGSLQYRSPIDWAREAESLGAGEILLSCVDRDGGCAGLDIQTARHCASSLRIPLIVASGCGLAAHFVEGFLEAGASAVAAGTFFCFKDQNPMQTRSHIRNAGIPIRLHQ